MEGHWEQGTRQEEQSSREWIVEYRVDIGKHSYHHLSMIVAQNLQNVQALLFEELRDEYNHAERIDVTIIRMEPIDTHAQVGGFTSTGVYHP